MKVRNTYYNFQNDMPDEAQIKARYAAGDKKKPYKPPYTKTGANYAAGKVDPSTGIVYHANTITKGPDWKAIITPSREGMKVTALVALAGIGYALYKKQSVILYGAVGAGAGIVGYNAYKMFIQPNLKPKGNATEIGQSNP